MAVGAKLRTVMSSIIRWRKGESLRAVGMIPGEREQDSGTKVNTDRLVHNAHRIEMRGDSMRKSRGKLNG